MAWANGGLVEHLRDEDGSAADHAAKARLLADGAGATGLAELARTAQTLIATRVKGKTPGLSVRKSASANGASDPVHLELPEPSSVQFAADPRDEIFIAASSPPEAALTIQAKSTVDFTVIRLRMGAEKLFIIDGDANYAPVFDVLSRLRKAPELERKTALGSMGLYTGSRLVVERDRDSRVVRWMRFEWAE